MKCVIKVIVASLSFLICAGQLESEINYGTSYLINTERCRIPNIPVFSPELNLTRDLLNPCTSYDPLLSYTTVKNDTAWLHINREAIIKYFGSSYGLKCCYSYMYRSGSPDWPDVGVMASPCRPIIFLIQLYHDLVRVTCTNQNGSATRPVYDNIHQVITLSDNVKVKTERLLKTGPNRKISVLMIVIDSLSRLNFYRTMPHTKDWVKSHGFYEFVGYNKVGDNTFPNAMPVLAGLTLNEAKQICKPEEIDGLNNCPFIWNYYRDFGYVTAFAEDWSQIATFNYLMKGFRQSPTDYYFKPYMDAITYLPTIYQDTMPFCAGPVSQGERILNMAEDFATTFKHAPSFGVFWMNTFSHNYITTPMMMDIKVKKFLENLQQSGALNDSMVILLSDHGFRFGKIVNTTRRFYELRLPMNFISLPVWFRDEYPEQFTNFMKNTKKLTSNFDLHMTLQDVLKLSTGSYGRTALKACPRCRSLFEKIEDDRGCPDAGIPSEWCTCNAKSTRTFICYLMLLVHIPTLNN